MCIDMDFFFDMELSKGGVEFFDLRGWEVEPQAVADGDDEEVEKDSSLGREEVTPHDIIFFEGCGVGRYEGLQEGEAVFSCNGDKVEIEFVKVLGHELIKHEGEGSARRFKTR